MKASVKAAFITGIFGIMGTVSAAIIGLDAGKNIEQQNIQNDINEVMGDVVSIIGDRNEVTINDIKDLVQDYQNLQAENKSLTAQNSKYFQDLTDANSRIEDFESQMGSMPDVQTRDIGLSINGNVIPINSTNSSVVINNRTYYSEEFIDNVIDENMNISIQDNMMYIGKIIKGKSNLLDQWEFDRSKVWSYDNVTDSYGKMHTNSLVFYESKCYIVYNLNREFSLLKFNLSVRDNAYNDKTGILTIKADDEIVYTSPALSKTTEKFDEFDIPIKNCSLLTFEYNTTGENDCIMSDIEIYN